MSITESDLTPAYIQSARIIDVDPTTWTMTVRTEVGQQDFRNVPINSLYTHPFEGEGIHVMPEPGAFIWLARSSETDARPFALTCKGLNNQSGSHKANRPAMNTGDMVFQTRDRNGLKLRRGGVVEIYSTPIARIMLLPNSNEVLTIAENYRLEAFAGKLKFSTFRGEEDPDLQKGGQFSLSVKEFVDHPHPVLELKVGTQISDETDQILDLRVWQDSTLVLEDDGPLRESVSITANRTGTLNITSYRPAPETEPEELVPSVSVELRNTGDMTVLSPDSVQVDINEDAEVKVHLQKAGGQFTVFEEEANTVGVILGPQLLSGLQGSLTEIQAALNGLGIPTPNTILFLADVATSLAVAPKGGAPLISTRTRTE